MLKFLVIILLSGCAGQHTTSLQGPKGDKGDPGAIGPIGDKGPKGDTGAPGLNGTQITVVKFCSQTSSYPTVFPEVGLCIGNKIYAVYSANDGFLVEVVPGYYNSNAIGSHCNFAVSANCVITH